MSKILFWLGRLFGRVAKTGYPYAGPFPEWAVWRVEIRETVREALTGSRRVRVTIRKNRTDAIAYLLGMRVAGFIELSDDDWQNMYRVCTTGDWDGVSQTLMVTLPDKFEENLFVEAMDPLIKKIEVVD